MIQEFKIGTSSRNQLIDITSTISKFIREAGVESGICMIYTPHTTAGITINENADPSVKSDIANKLINLLPQQDNYQHMEGNSDAHIKSSLVGCSENVIIKDSSPVLGTWQGIMFCEFDGPRSRRFIVKIIKD